MPHAMSFATKYLLYLLVVISLGSCSYGVHLEVVSSNRPSLDSDSCDVIFTKYAYPHAHFSDDQIQLIQNIRLYDNITSNCTETEAKNLLKREACAVGGNWVSITKERFPDLLSTCYQCEASIYFVQLDSTSQSSDYVPPANPYQDDLELATIKRQKGEVWGYILGFALGFTLTLLLLQ